MPLVSFKELMAEAERGSYAVGYFESWHSDSLLAVADAAEAARSPVILGFSGLFLPHPGRAVSDRLAPYAALALEVGRGLSVPACLLFNESPRMDWVLEAIRLGFQLVMFSDDSLPREEQVARIREVVEAAHALSAAVEAEIDSLLECTSEGIVLRERVSLTDSRRACEFIERAGVDALAVNVGQVHSRGPARVRLNLDRLVELKRAVPVPLVLHAASSVEPSDLAEAARLGIRKINVGSKLKRAYLDALKRACLELGADYSPYEVVGSGLPQDVLVIARKALQETVEQYMRVFGSAGRAR